MAFEGLPPSPNWYCSAASDTNREGVLAYASRNSVVLLDISEERQTLIGYLHGHEQRVTGLAFNDFEQQLLSTCGDDRRVVVWNSRSKSLVKQHERHEDKVTSVAWSSLDKDVLITGDERGTIISWNLADEEILQWMPEREQIACIAHATNKCHHLAVGYRSGLILVLDLKRRKEAVISRLRGHDSDVHSMCWSPSPWQQSDNSSPAEGGHALLSGGKDQTLRLWSPHNEDMLYVLRLPAKGGTKSRHRVDDGSARSRLWISIWWPRDQPKQFLSSSFGGDIVLWDLSKQKPKWTILGQDSPETHTRPVFSILPVKEKFFITSSMDRQVVLWSSDTHMPCWGVPTLGGFIYQIMMAPLDTSTIAMGVGDNMIRVWNTSVRGASRQSTTLWQGLRSKVTTICWHPEREGLLAFGTDDGKVGMFTAINPGKAPVLSRTFHKKTVYSLSFGPQCSKTSELKAEDQGNICLFSCGGDGVIYQHHPTSLQEEAVGIDAIVRDTNSFQHMLPLRSEVSWRSDRSVVAIGNDDGSIEVFGAPHLLMLCIIQVHHKIINCLQWFPNQISQGQRSPLQFCLASGSNETVVYVHDLASVLGKEELVPLTAPMSSAFRTLSGHMLRITALQWNPVGDGRLVSVSYDGTVQVWDVTTGEPIANFRGHQGRLLSVAWSHLDPDTIFSGGEDFCLMKWKISECIYSRPPKDKQELNVKFYNTGPSKKDVKKKKKNNKGKGSSVFSQTSMAPTLENMESPPLGTAHPSTDPSVSTNRGGESPTGKPVLAASPVRIREKELLSITELLEKKRRELMEEDATAKDDRIPGDECTLGEGRVTEDYQPEVGQSEGNKGLEVKGHDVETVEQIPAGTSRSKRRKGKSYFPVCGKLDNRGRPFFLKDCRDIAERKYGPAEGCLPPLNDDSVNIGLFTSRRDMLQTINAEGIHHTKHGNHDVKTWLNVWQGRLLPIIREATHEGQLNDRLVAMAPQAGHDVWLETCRSYAKQLENSGDPQKAATYYVCCHQVYDAVRVLRENKHFREAISLAMARLGTTDPVLQEIYQAWASQLEGDHCFELAARCCLAMDKPENAVRLLARSGSQPSLRTALEVAILTNQRDMLTSLVPRYANECMLNGDWSEPWQIKSSDAAVLALHLVTVIHEALCLNLSECGTRLSELFTGCKHSLDVTKISVKGQDLFSGCPLLVLDSVPLLAAAIKTWENRQLELCGSEINRADLSKTVKDLFVPSLDTHVKKQFLISTAICIALDHLTSEEPNACHNVERILDQCYQDSEFDLLQAVLSLVHPDGFFHEAMVVTASDSESDTTTDASLVQSYYASVAMYNQWWTMPAIPRSDSPSMKTSPPASKVSLLHQNDSTTINGESLSFKEALCNRGVTVGDDLLSKSDITTENTSNGHSYNCSSDGSDKVPEMANGDAKKLSKVPNSGQNGGYSEQTSLDANSSAGHVPNMEKTDKPVTSTSETFHDLLRTVLKRVQICVPILVGTPSCIEVTSSGLEETPALLWYKLRAELKEIEKAKSNLTSRDRRTNTVDGAAFATQQRVDLTNGVREDRLEIDQDGPYSSYDGALGTNSSSETERTEQSDRSGAISECVSRRLAEEAVSYNSVKAVEGDASVPSKVNGCASLEHLPIFERYSHPSITMEMLQCEEERIREELSSWSFICQPPDPVESALVITSILTTIVLCGHKDKISDTLLEELLQWGTRNCYTKQQQKHIARLAQKVYGGSQ